MTSRLLVHYLSIFQSTLHLIQSLVCLYVSYALFYFLTFHFCLLCNFSSEAVMRPLQQLPVWVVIRLCTNEDRMVEYWNNIDSAIELNMDVIDDPLGEATEIYRWVRAILGLRDQQYHTSVYPSHHVPNTPLICTCDQDE
jgi:hypothetical protein